MRKKWWCHSGLKLLMLTMFIGSIVGVFYYIFAMSYEIEKFSENTGSENYDYIELRPQEALYQSYKAIVNYYGNGLTEESILAGEHIDLTGYDQEVKYFEENALNEKLQYLLNEQITYSLNGKNEIILLGLDEAIKEKTENEFKRIDDNLSNNIDKYKESVIRIQLADMKWINEIFDTYKDYIDYVVYLKDNTIKTNLNIDLTDTNVVNYFAERPYSDTYNIAYKMPTIGGIDVTKETPANVSEVFIAISDKYLENMALIEARNVEFEIARNAIYTKYIINIILLIIACLFSTLYLILMAGEKVDDDEVHLLVYDKFYVDISIGISIFLMIMIFSILMEALMYYHNKTSPIIYIGSVTLGLMLLGTLMSIAKHLKRHELFKYTLIYQVVSKIYIKIVNYLVKVKETNNSISTSLKGTIILGMIANVLLIIFCLLLTIFFFRASFFGIFIMGIFGFVCEYTIICFVIASYQKDLENIKKGVNIIKNGNLDYQIKNMKHTSIKAIADDINLISDGLNLSVKKAVESEKMKSELVTNVSHDLKTPLTSIINYVDLLSKKESMDDDAKHYLNVLIDKSNQLKKLVEDLFEMTKAQSGQIKVDIIPLCIDDLITQSLVEYEDKLASKELDVRVMALDYKCMVYADGNRTWRVLSNIISNICKYSLERTRVYIAYAEIDDTCEITFKNISSYFMDFSGNEMTERFKRADGSRNSEGNGLGLAIASSFMELQNASLDIIVDGDLFKVKLTFKRVISNDKEIDTLLV